MKRFLKEYVFIKYPSLEDRMHKEALRVTLLSDRGVLNKYNSRSMEDVSNKAYLYYRNEDCCKKSPLLFLLLLQKTPKRLLTSLMLLLPK